MTDLKPCPFCGVVPRLGFRRTSVGDYCTLYADHEEDCFFMFINCVAEAPNHGTLIKKWNQRRRTNGRNGGGIISGGDV